MNPETNELIKIAKDAEVPEGFLEVPEQLNDAAKQVLGEKVKKVVTGETNYGKMLKAWSRNERKKQKIRKGKRKAQRTARKKNR